MHRPAVLTKTSLMLGLGETDAEILATMADLRAASVDILTFGQYLRPTANHLSVERFVSPEQFAQYRDWALEPGIPGMRVRPSGAFELSRRAGLARHVRARGRPGAPRCGAGPIAVSGAPLIRHLGLVPYESDLACDAALHRRARCRRRADEIWILEHHPVFTLGLNAEPRTPEVGRRHSGGANRSRRSGDLSRAGSARGLPAHRPAPPRARSPAAGRGARERRHRLSRPSSASRRDRIAPGPRGVRRRRETREHRVCAFAAGPAITAWRSMCRRISSRSNESTCAATLISRSLGSRTCAASAASTRRPRDCYPIC